MYSMNDLNQRRAVVYQILKEVLTQRECMQALWLLENKYKNLSVVPILEYVDCVEQEVLNLGEFKLYIGRELTKILYGPSTDVYPDPWQDMQLYELNQESTLSSGPRIDSEKLSSNP